MWGCFCSSIHALKWQLFGEMTSPPEY
uniref:Uncharacterized protein n=1 Tax=Anguilla anguilla TaxID=7936 RepID=A0A0E9VYI6_ANGAN